MEKLYTKPSLFEFGALRDLTKSSGSITDTDIIFSGLVNPPVIITTGVGSDDNCVISVNPPTIANCPDTFPGGQSKDIPTP